MNGGLAYNRLSAVNSRKSFSKRSKLCFKGFYLVQLIQSGGFSWIWFLKRPIEWRILVISSSKILTFSAVLKNIGDIMITFISNSYCKRCLLTNPNIQVGNTSLIDPYSSPMPHRAAQHLVVGRMCQSSFSIMRS